MEKKFNKEKMMEMAKKWTPRVIVGGFAIFGVVAASQAAYDQVMFEHPRTIKGTVFADNEDKTFGITWVPKDRFGHEHESRRQRLRWRGEEASENFVESFRQVNAIIKGEQKDFTD